VDGGRPGLGRGGAGVSARLLVRVEIGDIRWRDTFDVLTKQSDIKHLADEW
jgi:hypothetical protein